MWAHIATLILSGSNSHILGTVTVFLQFVHSFLSQVPFQEPLYICIVGDSLENKVLVIEGVVISTNSSFHTIPRKLIFLSAILEFYS
jgi:hypothetical protein